MRSLVSTGCLFPVVVFSMVSAVLVHGQEGFMNIDCGKPEGHVYNDSLTGLTYYSDFEFIDTGEIHWVSSEYANAGSQLDLRSFPNGTRNCYTLRNVTKGKRYLVKALFLYGNYDGQSRLPQFDLYLGINLWRTVRISNASNYYREEIISVATTDSISVCLVNTDSGIPFISTLELRPLSDDTYSEVLKNTSQSLILFYRGDFGGNQYVRYKTDIFDRVWLPFTLPEWTVLTSDIAFDKPNNFAPPAIVMKTAVTPKNGSTLGFKWDLSSMILPSTRFHVFLHFAEVQNLGNDTRIFNINVTDDGKDANFYYNYSPVSSINTVYSKWPRECREKLRIDLLQTNDSSLPPILNAIEVYMVMDITESETDSSDVDAIDHVKAFYQLQKNWMGDPCLPKKFIWDGLNCSYASPDGPRIIALNLSSNKLTGEIPNFLSNLTKLEYLDLSRNNLTGNIPDFLANLTSLKLLDLSGNKLNGSIPKSLLDKQATGVLELRTGDMPSSCSYLDSCQPNEKKKKKKKFFVIVVSIGSAVAVVIIVALVILWTSKGKNQDTHDIDKIQTKPKAGSFRMRSFKSESRQFTFIELARITDNFKKEIGKGGFGSVYHGILEDNTEVAVKMLSHSSSQGTKEFQAEAQLLTRIHHRNLVPMVGYCNDMNHLALVYEYMAEGSLKDHLSGKLHNARVSSWRERIRMAIEAAQGLEYLHKGCKPPVVHRDVKTSNILLTNNLEARIADFGLSKIFNSDGHTHVSTKVAGTPGYLDPEYSITSSLNEKSDVYSFGVVLFELITGLPAIVRSEKNVHITEWVKPSIERGEIIEIVDKELQGDYNINSIWKFVEIAFACVPPISIQRPSMNEVLMLLQECLKLEITQESTESSSYINLDASNNMLLDIGSTQESLITIPSAR